MFLERKKNDTPQCDRLMTYHVATARYPRDACVQKKKQEYVKGVLFVWCEAAAPGGRRT